MQRAFEIELARRLLAHAEAGTTDLAPEQMTVPAGIYRDEALWEQEVEQLFRRQPIVACLSCEIAEAGSWLALTLIGVPVLLVRDDDGQLRAFLNVCTHRSAKVATETPCAQPGKRFSCPYHGWTYDAGGRLIGVANADSFGSLAREDYGLTPLNVDERAGLVFVVLRPEVEIDFGGFLLGVDRAIGDHATDFAFAGEASARGANWKLMMEGHLESYHFAALHRNSIAAFQRTNCATFDAFGKHQLITFAHKDIIRLRNLPEDDWQPIRDNLIQPQFILFPGTTVTLFNDALLVQALRPGGGPGHSVNRMAWAQPRGATGGEEALEGVRRLVQDEDYDASFAIYEALGAGARDHAIFGRNEPSVQYFHKALAGVI